MKRLFQTLSILTMLPVAAMAGSGGPFDIEFEFSSLGCGSATGGMFAIEYAEAVPILGIGSGGPFEMCSGGGFLAGLDTRLVSASSSSRGTIDPSGSIEVDYGANLQLGMNAELYYHVDRVDLEGVPYVENIDQSQYSMVLSNIITDLSVYSVVLPDLTVQGTPHWWLAAHYLTNQAWDIEAGIDHDEDGYRTADEWVTDTSPTNSLDYFILYAMSISNSVVVEFDGSPTRVYTLEYLMHPRTGEWHQVTGQVDLWGQGPGQTLTHNSPSSTTGYYRVEVAMPPGE